MSVTKLKLKTSTKLKRVAKLSSEDSKCEFKWLIGHLNKESLIECFHELDGRKAVGIDGITKEEYGKALEENIENLISKMKSMSYRPQPVREVLIPKDDGQGGVRPLGISNFEDKMVQLMASKILTAIYEPIFYKNSYGFRPGRSCHTAIKDLWNHLYSNWMETVIDIDLKNFFGTVDHQMLMKMLSLKIKDKTFLRYIGRMLKSGILSKSGLIKTEEGTPQGSVVSPILANIYAHYAIDDWINKVVKKHARQSIEMFRYADDIVICCKYNSDAKAIRKVLVKRLEKFSLVLNETKTKMVKFSRYEASLGIKQESFDFLGFTFYICKALKSKGQIVRIKTSRKRLRSKLANVKRWLRLNRHKVNVLTLWNRFRIKLLGHFQYYGVTFNVDGLSMFATKATCLFFKWINRRSQRKSISWGKFIKFYKTYPAPRARVYFPLYR